MGEGNVRIIVTKITSAETKTRLKTIMDSDHKKSVKVNSLETYRSVGKIELGRTINLLKNLRSFVDTRFLSPRYGCSPYPFGNNLLLIRTMKPLDKSHVVTRSDVALRFYLCQCDEKVTSN